MRVYEVSLESRLTSLPPRPTTIGLISAADLTSLRTSLSVLSGAATEAWKPYGGSIALPNPSDSVVAWLRKPATELYRAAHVVASVSLDTVEETEVDEEIESEIDEQDGVFEARLRRLDPELVGVFRGGVQALERGGADWQRHTLVSFREVATHVLHKLSPDEDVKKIAAEADIVRGNPMVFLFDSSGTENAEAGSGMGVELLVDFGVGDVGKVLG